MSHLERRRRKRKRKKGRSAVNCLVPLTVLPSSGNKMLTTGSCCTLPTLAAVTAYVTLLLSPLSQWLHSLIIWLPFSFLRLLRRVHPPICPIGLLVSFMLAANTVPGAVTSSQISPLKSRPTCRIPPGLLHFTHVAHGNHSELGTSTMEIMAS